MDWLDLLEVQGTLKSLLQHHSSKASILQYSAFFTVQLLHPYMTPEKTIALTRWTFVGKVMSLLFKMLSKLVITFLPRSKRLLISWLQSASTVIYWENTVKLGFQGHAECSIWTLWHKCELSAAGFCEETVSCPPTVLLFLLSNRITHF